MKNAEIGTYGIGPGIFLEPVFDVELDGPVYGNG
jgi:hypothetical protein